jgi:RNA polymerase sigma-70 factor, ECF subfamily
MTSDFEATEQFVRLLAAHERRLNAYILTLVPNWSDAEEIAQEVKVRLWQQFADYDSTRDFGVWSRAVAYYFVLTYRQHKGRRPHTLAHDVLEAVSEQVAAQACELDARHEALAACLAKLTAVQRDLVMRWYSGGETSRQIAASLGRSFEAARKSILRIRNRLADCVRRTLRKEEERA